MLISGGKLTWDDFTWDSFVYDTIALVAFGNDIGCLIVLLGRKKEC